MIQYIERKKHAAVAVEIKDEYVIYVCPICGYRAKQWFDGGFERLNLGEGNVTHIGTASQVDGVELQIDEAQIAIVDRK